MARIVWDEPISGEHGTVASLVDPRRRESVTPMGLMALLLTLVLVTIPMVRTSDVESSEEGLSLVQRAKARLSKQGVHGAQAKGDVEEDIEKLKSMLPPNGIKEYGTVLMNVLKEARKNIYNTHSQYGTGPNPNRTPEEEQRLWEEFAKPAKADSKSVAELFG